MSSTEDIIFLERNILFIMARSIMSKTLWGQAPLFPYSDKEMLISLSSRDSRNNLPTCLDRFAVRDAPPVVHASWLLMTKRRQRGNQGRRQIQAWIIWTILIPTAFIAAAGLYLDLTAVDTVLASITGLPRLLLGTTATRKKLVAAHSFLFNGTSGILVRQSMFGLRRFFDVIILFGFNRYLLPTPSSCGAHMSFGRDQNG